MKKYIITGRSWRPEIFAIRKPTIRDLEWAAGFLEGEGCFSRYSAITAAQVNPEPLIKLQGMFGGPISRKPKAKPSHHWLWSVSGKRGRGIALTLYVLLSYKRQQQIRQHHLGLDK